MKTKHEPVEQKRERKSAREKRDYQAHEAWERRKREGRPKQCWMPETNTWEKVVDEHLAIQTEQEE